MDLDMNNVVFQFHFFSKITEGRKKSGDGSGKNLGS